MIRSVKLENFKSFRESSFSLSPLTLIVGANGSGKSNFFDALRFLRFVGDGTSIRDAIEGHSGIAPTDISVAGLRGGSSEVVYFGSDDHIFTIEAQLDAGDDLLQYRISVDVLAYRVVLEELKSQQHPGQYVFSTHPEADPLAQDEDSPALAARFYKETRGRNPRRMFSPHTSILSQFQGRQAESRLNETAAQKARTELQSIKPLELRPEILRQYSPLGIFELGEHGENMPAVAWWLLQDESDEAQYRMDAIKSWLTELTPHHVLSVETMSAPTGEVILGFREDAYPDQPITARSLSDGTLRFVALAFAVLGDDTRRTLVIEEIENGIHAARIALLLRMLEENTSPEEGVQVIASTHSTAVLDLASKTTLEGTLIVGWNEEEACSRVVRMVDLPNVREAHERHDLGELQLEGWLQFAADA